MKKFLHLGSTSESEERMRSVIDHVVDGIITINGRGMVATFNPAAERIFGYQSAEVIGQNVKMLMAEPYRGEHDGYISNYLRTGQACASWPSRAMARTRIACVRARRASTST